MKTLVYVQHRDEIIKDWMQLSVLAFIQQFTRLRIIWARWPQNLAEDLPADLAADEIAGVFCHEDRYEMRTHLEVINYIRERFGPKVPIAVWPNDSNWRDGIDDDQVFEYRFCGADLPSFIREEIGEFHAEPDESYLALDEHYFPFQTADEYATALTKAESLDTDALSACLSESNSDGVSQGPYQFGFVIEPVTLLSVATNECGLHHYVANTLIHYLSAVANVLRDARNYPELKEFIRGWIYRETGGVGLPVLRLAASAEDWNSAEYGPDLRRICAWAHAQRQVIPMLDDKRIITLADL